MTQRSTFFGLQGGLDLTTPAILMPPGRVIAVSNHECRDEGYGRVDGYERYDGKLSPTAAFDDAGEGDGVAAREAARTAITPLPGSGPIRGVWRFNDKTYAWRDNVGATAAALYVSSPSGWQLVPLGSDIDFTAGSMEIEAGDLITGATSGATATVRNVIVTEGSWDTNDAAGYLVVTGISGAFSAAENLTILAGTAAVFASMAALTWPAGGRYGFITHNFYGAVGSNRVYGVNGVGRGFTFGADEHVTFIRTGMPVDTPTRVGAYRKHLFYAFPKGSVQNSATGEPLVWDAKLGASEIAIGDEIADFSVSTDALTIMGVSSIHTLTGSDSTDFVLTNLSDEAGAIPYSHQRIGVAIYLDNAGFRSVTTTQAYGDFKLGTLVAQIQPMLKQLKKSGAHLTASMRVRGKTHYRAFFSDGTGISIYMGRKYPEAMAFLLNCTVMCACSVEDSDGNERCFIGADDGLVHEMEVGTSFDGEEIQAFLMLSFNHLGSPRQLKRWHKAIVEMISSPTTRLGSSAEFDYAGNEQTNTGYEIALVQGGGGLWNAATWNDFFWSVPFEGSAEFWLDGQGKNMSLILTSISTEEPGYVLQGISYDYSVRGQLR